MNKFTRALFLSVFIIGLLFSAHNVAQAASTSPKGCTATTNYSPLTGQKCPKGSVLGATTEITGSDETTNNPIATSLYPASGPVGTSVQISGSGFTPTDNTVNFGTTKIFGQTSMTACPSSNNAGGGSCITYITFTVPQNINNCNAVGTACTGLFGVVSPGSYPISVTNANGTSNSVNFTVTSDTSAPSITVLSPNGGETYQSGGKILVTWSTNNVSPTENLFVTLHRDADPNNSFYLTVGTPNDGKEEFVIPYDAAQGNYKLRIGSFSANIAQDYSDNMFSLTRDKNATYTLSVSSSYGSTGDMLITSPNNGIYCPLYNSSLPHPAFPGTCSKLFPIDTTLATQTVSLTVAPNQGSTFVKWTDDCSAYGSATQITFTMTSSMKCNALVTLNTITPSITVLSPNGGEVYQAGSQMTIRWNSANTFEKKVSIGLVTPTGATYGIVNDTYDSGSYVWTIPSKLNIVGDGGSADVPFGKNFKIAISDDGSPRAYDISDNLFTINGKTTSTDCTINSFTATPNLIPEGGSTTLSWSTSGCTNADLNGTTSTGDAWDRGVRDDVNNLVVYGPPNWMFEYGDNGTYTFTLVVSSGPGMPLVKKTINVSIIKPGSLDTTPRIAYWYGKVNQHVDDHGNWISDPDGTSGANIDKLTYCKKWYPDTTRVEPYMKETITTWKRAMGYEQSDYTNTVMTDKCVQGTTTQSITVVTPNGGEVYQSGQQITVKWTSVNIPDTDTMKVLVGYFGPGSLNPTTTQAVLVTTNTHIATLTLPIIPNADMTILQPGNYYKIVVTDTNTAPTVADWSDDFFTINEQPSTCTSPSVSVISPNGGESYTPGQNIAVNWKTCRISRNTLMRLDLVMQKANGGTLTRFLKTTSNDGIDTAVKLPTNVSWRQMVYGNNFKIRIRKTSSTTPQDSSDSNFSIATAIPASVTVSTDPNTPPAGTVLVNNTANTNNVTIFKFQVKATGSDLNIRRIPILINSSSTPISAITNTIKLFRDGNIIDALDSTNGSYSNNTGGTSIGYIFSNISAPGNIISDGTTANFSIVVDIKSLIGHYTEGETLTASFTNTDVLSTTNFSVQDANGDLLPSSQRSGSAQGQMQTLRTTCTNVVMGTTTITPTVEIGSGNISQLVYSIPIAVTACGGTSYIGQSAQLATTASGSNAFAYAFNVASNPSTPDTTSVASSTFSSSDAVTEGNGYRIDDGTTKHFTLTTTLVTPSIQNSSYRVVLEQIRTFTNGMLTTGETNINLLPSNSYQTPYAFINN